MSCVKHEQNLVRTRRLPCVCVLQYDYEFGFVRHNSFCVSIVEEPSVAHQKMREVSSMSGYKYFTQQAYHVVQRS